MNGLLRNHENSDVDLSKYPHTVISNKEVKMKLYLPDPENGLYRATRFDWSGMIGSVQYKGHEYFGYWKDTHDPLVHEDIVGPVEAYIKPGLGYREAVPGGKFIRIGIGVIEKPNESSYRWNETYTILDHGKWMIDKRKDWISFTHVLGSDIGYGYIYKKTVRLKNDGFAIEHQLKNTGEKTIETDQFNHNFFMIDNEQSGPSFSVSFPFAISTEHDLKGIMEARGNELVFLKDLGENSVYMVLDGYGKDVEDHQFTVVNNKSGAGVTCSVDKPLTRMVFWTMKTTVCPENSVRIFVEPGQEQEWTSYYTLFVK